MKVALLSIPGSTPPDLKFGATVRGRWGGWGADFHSVIFEPESKLPSRKEMGKAYRLFFGGLRLTEFSPTSLGSHWNENQKGIYTKAILQSQGFQIFIASPKYSKNKRDSKIDFSLDNKNTIASLGQGEWSDWIPYSVNYQNSKLQTAIKLKVIKRWTNGDFRIRLLINGLNQMNVVPPVLAESLEKGAGPMVDFPDNWPHQLIQEAEDRGTFLEEAIMSWQWHQKATATVIKEFKPQIFIHDIYTPNLMLESRWWYKDIHTKSRKAAHKEWKEVEEMYAGIDSILGETMKNADENTLVVFSSDHGVCYLKSLVKLNNLFAQKGWLKYSIDEKTGEPTINWKETKVIYLKMAYVYINPNGLAEKWKRGSGPEYLKLRNEVIDLLKSLKDKQGINPVQNIVAVEDVNKTYNLPEDRVGDLTLEAKLGYFWYEEVDKKGDIFTSPKATGYKQSIDPVKNECMWTPVVFWGEKVKKGFAIKDPIHHYQQAPTILKIMGKKVPDFMTGKPVEEIMEN